MAKASCRKAVEMVQAFLANRPMLLAAGRYKPASTLECAGHMAGLRDVDHRSGASPLVTYPVASVSAAEVQARNMAMACPSSSASRPPTLREVQPGEPLTRTPEVQMPRTPFLEQWTRPLPDGSVLRVLRLLLQALRVRLPTRLLSLVRGLSFSDASGQGGQSGCWHLRPFRDASFQPPHELQWQSG